MRRVIVLCAVVAVALLGLVAGHRVLAQPVGPPAGVFESVAGFDVAMQDGKDVYFSVLMRDVGGNLRVDVYDGGGVKRGEIKLKPPAETPIRPE